MTIKYMYILMLVAAISFAVEAEEFGKCTLSDEEQKALDNLTLAQPETEEGQELLKTYQCYPRDMDKHIKMIESCAKTELGDTESSGTEVMQKMNDNMNEDDEDKMLSCIMENQQSNGGGGLNDIYITPEALKKLYCENRKCAARFDPKIKQNHKDLRLCSSAAAKKICSPDKAEDKTSASSE